VLVPVGPTGRATNVLFRANLGLTSRGETVEAARLKIASALAEGSHVVFPENIFNCPHRHELINQVQLSRGRCWMQVSAGLELSLHQKEMEAIAAQFPDWGFEVLFDRAPHSRDLSIMETIGFSRFRFTYVPCSNFEPLAELKKMRGLIFSNLSFYFREKKELSDTALSPSQIYVLLAKMRLELPQLLAQPAAHLYEIESSPDQATKRIRRSLRPEDYENESPRSYGRATTTFRWLSVGRFTRPVVWVLFGFFWLFKDPAEAICAGVRRIYWVLNGGISLAARELRKARTLLYWQVFFRSLCSFQLSAGTVMKFVGAAYGRLIDIFYFGYDRSLRLFYFLGHVFRNWILGKPARMRLYWAIIRFYWAFLYPMKHSLRYRAWGIYYSLGYRLYFTLYSWFCFCAAFLRSPIWSSKEYVPWLYWPLVFPFVKSFWFLRFQWRKRLWGVHEQN
jgi:hypothetical protein